MDDTQANEQYDTIIKELEYQNELIKERSKRREQELLDALKEKDNKIENLKKTLAFLKENKMMNENNNNNHESSLIEKNDKLEKELRALQTQNNAFAKIKQDLLQRCDELSFKIIESDRENKDLKAHCNRLEIDLRKSQENHLKVNNQSFQLQKSPRNFNGNYNKLNEIIKSPYPSKIPYNNTPDDKNIMNKNDSLSDNKIITKNVDNSQLTVECFEGIMKKMYGDLKEEIVNGKQEVITTLQEIEKLSRAFQSEFNAMTLMVTETIKNNFNASSSSSSSPSGAIKRNSNQQKNEINNKENEHENNVVAVNAINDTITPTLTPPVKSKPRRTKTEQHKILKEENYQQEIQNNDMKKHSEELTPVPESIRINKRRGRKPKALQIKNYDDNDDDNDNDNKSLDNNKIGKISNVSKTVANIVKTKGTRNTRRNRAEVNYNEL